MPSPPVLLRLPPIKILIYSSIRGYRGTRFTITPLTFLPIVSMLDTAITTTTFISTEFVKEYSIIAIFIRINIVYK